MAKKAKRAIDRQKTLNATSKAGPKADSTQSVFKHGYDKVVAATRMGNLDMFKDGVAALELAGISVFTVRFVDEDDLSIVSAAELALRRRCASVFTELVNTAIAKVRQKPQDIWPLKILLDALSSRIQAFKIEYGKDVEAWYYSNLVNCILELGIRVEGPARVGYPGKIWDHVCAERAAQEEKAALELAIATLSRKGASRGGSRL